MDTPNKRKRRKGRKLSEQEKAARNAAREAKRKSAKMRTPKELSQALGVGINQTYAALERGQIKGALRISQRWLIPQAVIDRILNGETLNAA